FSGSGMLHLLLLDKSRHEAAPWPHSGEALPVAALTLSPATLPMADGESLQVLAMNGQPVWRLSPPARAMVGKTAHDGHAATSARGAQARGHEGHEGHAGHVAMPKAPVQDRYFNAEGEWLAEGPEQHARLLATAHTGLPPEQIASVEKITRFEGEYGFINKRLPVYRVGYDRPDRLAVFVETVSGVTAAEVRNAQRVEGWSFAYLHKWTFLDALGKNLRDALVGLMALLIVVTVLLGLRLALRRRTV
ncbi:MAG: hypothetical protein ACK4UT_07760, partial [Moraxellaceae bacterium]